MLLWRIGNHFDLSGKGAVIAPGRWNRAGLPLVYTAETPPGALLEHLVHLVMRNGKLPKTYGLLKIKVPENLAILELNPVQAEGWQDSLEMTQAAGDAWLKSLDTPLARVPSVIMRDTWNVLLNPLHPAAGEIEIVSTTRDAFDLRLFRFSGR